MSVNHTLLQRRYQTMGHSSPLFYKQPLHLVRGEGVWLFDNEGQRYLDVYNNVPHVGHCNPRVVEALHRQASTLNTHTRYLNENVVQYIERLTATFDEGLSMAMLTCTGSEANELALRMARHCTGGEGVIVTEAAYHGNTSAVAEIGTGFMPEAKNSKRVKVFSIPDSYRGLAGVSQDDLADVYAAQVQQAIDEFEAEGIKLAGMLVCPDFANEGLLNVPKGFMEKATAMVRQAGGVLIADEVQAGFGRSGHHFWAHQQYDITPDIVTMGKPMGNGHPLAGVVARPDMIEEFTREAMYFNTFGGNPVSAAVGMAVLDSLEQDQLLQNAISTGDYVVRGLKKLQHKYELIGDIRSLGMFFAVELVSDRQQKTPAPEQAEQIMNLMKQQGVLISRIGIYDNILKLRPPMPFQPEHADLLLETLDRVFQQVCQLEALG
ncbi:aspartate aminotransferase family protein [Oceanospirillum sediminis]|uniref:Aminotransferase class III-fold pyridoxal phosphate-dependent enzyme n=1 Tax=Oceanospirillum sediminis TaxID=2760088 RepID=A0A839IVH1_9GAMM|nr:aminotransferase class III-fold pyridoxal phosphate-dependent enzyme [Oceanospirillum sediminis]MBB1488971.1 aminotransferase class III-fold pyridoxal phosphate-dependent enzyme [Oceanospirillum sediminis]